MNFFFELGTINSIRNIFVWIQDASSPFGLSSSLIGCSEENKISNPKSQKVTKMTKNYSKLSKMAENDQNDKNRKNGKNVLKNKRIDDK